MGSTNDKDEKTIKNNSLIESTNRIDEVLIKGKTESNKVDFDTIDKVRKSVCKLKIYDKDGIKYATGFFMIYFNQKFLITCNHVLNHDNKKLELEIWNKEIKTFELKNGYSIYLKKPIDAAVFEINNSDDFIENIDFLDYALNYIKGYSQYKDIEVFSLGYPNGEKLIADNGVIKNIIWNEFYHNINIENGSSGSPFILFTTLKVIGIHKQGHKTKNINIGTFFGEVLNYINNPQYILTSKLSQQNIIAVEIFDEYKCIINYKLSNNNLKYLGFFVKIPIVKNKFITGILSKYHIEENILNKINSINLYKNKELLEELNSKNNFNFSDEFLNVTFIEIISTNCQFIKIFQGNYFPEKIRLINFSQRQNSTKETLGNFIENWGTNIKYKSEPSENFAYLNSGLFIDNQLIGIHKKNYSKYSIGINIDIISKAIKLNYFEKINSNQALIDKKEDNIYLTKTQINELDKKGLKLTNTPNILVSPASFLITPIWFLRTKHAWYWTPTEPDKNDIDLANWMIIYPKNSLKVIGGYWDGQEPAQRNIDLIHWLETTKLIYCK